MTIATGSELKKQLDKVFQPESVAVVGVSARPDNPGTLLLRSLIDMGFEGTLYPINPKYETILDLECYPAVREIPKAPDLVILSIPPHSVPDVVAECAEAGVSACIINTAGFSESESPDGTKLEREILDAIKGSPLRLIGPNCMGVYSSPGRLATFAGQRPGGGKASLISQSGSVANFLYILGAERAVMFSKMVSSGNELDLNCADFLEYFADDPDTGMILMYLEEVREPRRFLRAALSVRGKKPLIIWKAGLTKGGRQAAVSHTGAAAGSEAVWNAVVRQAGIVPVEDLADIVDVASLFYHLGKPGGRGVCIISSPGGIAVNSADMVERNGLVVSGLSESTVERLREILPGEGTSLKNPVDMGFGAVIPGNLCEVLKAVAVDNRVDIIMVVGGAPASRKGDIGLMKMHTGEIKEAIKTIDKPVILIGIPSGWAFPFISEMSWAGIPGFLSPGAACRAVARFVSYYGL